MNKALRQELCLLKLPISHPSFKEFENNKKFLYIWIYYLAGIKKQVYLQRLRTKA
jgi:hypothetical protein